MWMVPGSPAENVLFAQVRRDPREFLLPAGVLVGVLVLGVWVFLRVKRWRQEIVDAVAVHPQDQIDHYQNMVEAGVLDPEELARIEAELARLASKTPPGPRDRSTPNDQPTDPSV